MYKQSPGRSHRSKGIKVKNVLQICLLLAVCFWLIYQVKHSHDKKKEFDEDDSKSSVKTESSNKLIKFGRKDLPQIEGSDTVNEKHKEEPEDETVEEEGNKPEEEDLEENNTKEKNDEHREDEVDDHDQEKNDEHREDGEDEVDDHNQEKNDEHREDGEDEVDDHDQEKNDEHREDGEDEVDDHDQEKSDGELDKEESVVDEDNERGEDNEKETEERDPEVNDGQVEEENSLEDHDHDEDSSSSHEAREEHYKADDASSAVTHDTVVTTTENENDKSEKEAERAAEAKSEVGINNNIMQINADQHATLALKVEDGKTDVVGSPPNTTNSEEKHDIRVSSTSADTSVSNSTSTEGLTDNSESSTHSIELSTQTHDLFLQNGTQAVNQEYNVTIGDTTSGGSNLTISSSQQNGNSTDLVDDNQIDSNSTSSSKHNEIDLVRVDSSNVSGDTEPSLTEKVVHGNATVEAVDNVGLPLKDNNEIKVEKADTSSEELGTTDEGVDASIAENLVEVPHDPIDSSDSFTHLEEKHIRTDVDTLPEIQTEGNMEDAVAE